MGLFKKGTKAYSVANFKCPKCHEGDLFETGSFSFQKSFDMPKHCSKCNQSYFPEPGFYYGAMFVSYIISGWFCLGFIFALHWGLGWSTMASFALLLTVIAIFFVWFFRFSRAIWINIAIAYSPKAAAQANQL